MLTEPKLFQIGNPLIHSFEKLCRYRLLARGSEFTLDRWAKHPRSEEGQPAPLRDAWCYISLLTVCDTGGSSIIELRSPR